MNRDAAEDTAVRTLSVPLASYPGLNQFARDLIARKEAATRFLPAKAWSSIRPAPGSRDEALAAALIRTNAGWGNDVASQVGQWVEGDTLAIVAGQQVCFAGGPLLVASKIASLISLRSNLERDGRKAAVFFWLATEDHDFDEVASATLQTGHGRIRLRADDPRPDPRQMVGGVSVPEVLADGLTAALAFDRPRWLREGITFRDSFAELIAEVFCGDGVILVDAMLPELRAAGAPLLRKIAGNTGRAEQILSDRSRELEEAGYAPQIAPVRGRYSLLYEVEGSGIRRPAEREVVAPPEQISTGAAARPLLQDAVLRTDVFVGGPSEVAYYAQVAALHAEFGIPLPHVALRGHILAAPRRTLGAISKYGLEPRDLFESPERVVARLDPEATVRMRQAVTDAEERIAGELEVLRNVILQADPGLRRGLERRLARVRYHFRRIEEQAGLAAARSDSDRFRAIGRLLETLAPAGEPQDRKTAWLPMWRLYGRGFIDALIDAAEPDSDTVAILGL